MKCDICGRVAVMAMPQHRLQLCEEHYVAWVSRMVQRAIDRYGLFTREESILVAVSGGKDSLALWEILIDLGYRAEGLYIHLGIAHEGYSDLSEAKVRAFAEQHGGAPYQVVNVADTYGLGIPALARRNRVSRPCSVCGTIKRHVMNRVAYEGGFAVVATGHNLDDEAATLLQNTLSWQEGYLRRQAPLLPADPAGLVRKVKPLYLLYEREMAGYALVRGVDYIEDECPLSVGAKTILYKETLNTLEARSPGAKRRFYMEFLQAKARGLFGEEVAHVRPLRPCARCGQPTTAEALCSFCRLWEAPR
ncbi:MAG: adenine nucleotide alpha hydrolase family protein [Chloroflexi bacterium]|nr:adenine nucleotide alpha hydrolase family protein [Chloroflexota bacterium]